MSNQDMFMRLLELTSQGYACSQILLMLGMELNGDENSAVVRTMAGLNEGMYGSGRLCGCYRTYLRKRHLHRLRRCFV